MELVKALIEDTALLTSISKRAFDSDVLVGATEEGGPFGYDSLMWHREIVKENHLFKAIVDEKIVGGAVLFYDKNSLYIGRIFVDPSYFHKGYGRELMKMIEETCEGMEIYLDTPIFNKRTNNFYLKLGYIENKRDKELVYYFKKL